MFMDHLAVQDYFDKFCGLDPFFLLKPRCLENDNKFLPRTRFSSLRVEDGRLYFADLSLRPQFATRIHNLDGVVNGISSMQDSRAQIQLDGEVDEYGMAGIKGEISLFDPAAYTDIAMIFRNLEMNNMTPYAGRQMGLN